MAFINIYGKFIFGDGFYNQTSSYNIKNSIDIFNPTPTVELPISQLLTSSLQIFQSTPNISNQIQRIENPFFLFQPTIRNGNYRLYTDIGGPGWFQNDILVAQKYDYDEYGTLIEIYNLTAVVNSVTAEGVYDVTISGTEEDWLQFEKNSTGIEFVKWGNTTNPDRQDNILMSSILPGSPFIDVLDGVNDPTDLNKLEYLKARVGKLDNINDSTFQNISGYGLYTDNAYLKGELHAKTGSIGEWRISNGLITGSGVTLDAINSKMYRTGFENEDSGSYINFVPNNYYLRFSTNFAVSSSGQLIASGAIIEGELSASTGSIGGWRIENDRIISKNNNMMLSSSGYISSSHFYIDENGKINGDSGSLSGWILTTSSLEDENNKIKLSPNGPYIISSSNFQVDLNGNLTSSNAYIDGIISSSEGNIGGWNINSQSLVGINMTMDSQNSRIYKNNDNSEIDGYYLDFTPGNNYYIRFGPNFAVSSSGQLIASGAVIEGILTASQGYIGGWKIESDRLVSDGSPYVNFISDINNSIAFSAGNTVRSNLESAPILIKHTGEITGSNVLFNGGKIGRWILTSNELKSAVANSRIELNPEKNRISIFDNTDAEKAVMGYLDGLTRNDGSGSWSSNDYGFWAKNGDYLQIDGDLTYTSGDWMIENDASVKIFNGDDIEIIRLGTDTGKKGLFLYDLSSTLLARFTSNDIYIGDETNNFSYSNLNGLQLTGSFNILNQSIINLSEFNDDENLSGSIVTNKTNISSNSDSINLNVISINNNTGSIETNSSNITLNSSSIALRVSQTEDDISSNYSLITQTSSSIALRVSSNDEDISTLYLSSSSFSTRITNNDGDISSINQDINSIEISVSDNANSISSLNITTGSILASVSDNANSISSLNITTGSILASVSDNEDNISTLELASGSFSTRITNNDGDITSINQDINSIDLRVTENEGSVSSINITTGSILASVSDNEDSISSLNITTGSILASVSDNENSISSLNITTGSILLSVSSNTSDIGDNSTSISSLNITTGSILASVSDNSTSISSLNITTGSILASVSNNTSDIGNNATSISSLNITTGSILASVSDNEDSISSLNITTGSILLSVSGKVDQNDVINQINISTEGIGIKGENIHLDGNTTVSGSFTVSGDVLSGGTISGVTITGGIIQTQDPTGGDGIQQAIVIDGSTNELKFYSENYTNPVLSITDSVYGSRPGISLYNGVIYNEFANAPYTSYIVIETDSIGIASSKADNNTGLVGINSNVQKDTPVNIYGGYFYVKNDSTNSSGNATAIYAEAITDKGNALAGNFVGGVKINDYVLPIAEGSSGEYIKSDGSGQLTWGTPSAGGGITEEEMVLQYLESRKIFDWKLNFTPASSHYSGASSMGSSIVETEKYILITFCDSLTADYKYHQLMRFNKGTNRIDIFRITTTNAYSGDNHKLPAMIVTAAGTLLIAIEQLPGNSNHNGIIDIFRYTDLDTITDDPAAVASIGNNSTTRLAYPFLFEMANGHIFLDARQYDGTNYDIRIYSKSTDDGATFGAIVEYVDYGDADYWMYSKQVAKNIKDRDSVILAIQPQNDASGANCYQYVTFLKTADFSTFTALDGTALGSSVIGSELAANSSWGDTTKNTNFYFFYNARMIDGEIIFIGSIGTRTSTTTNVTDIQVVKVNASTGVVTSGSTITTPYTSTSLIQMLPFKIGDTLYFMATYSSSIRIYSVAADLNSIALVTTIGTTYHPDILTNIYNDLICVYDSTNEIIEVFKI